MSFPRYPKYKESSIAWLGDVPEHWCVMPLKYIANGKSSLFIDGDWIESKDISDSGIRYITTGNVGIGCYKEQGEGFISEDTFAALNCTEVFPGDVLISRLNLPIGRACVVPELGVRFVTSVDNVIVRADNFICRKFLVYLLSASEYFANTEIMARGTTMQRISRSILGNVRICLPKSDEQKIIATFLDNETAKIDVLVAEQEKLIALLKEKRQAVISHAVTKGLNPNAKMKDSGIEWLGEVPEHWKMKRLKNISSSISVGIVVNPSEYVSEDGLPFIYGGDISEGKIAFETSRRITGADSRRNEKTRLDGGDLLTVRVGAPGVTAVVPPDCKGGNCASVMYIKKGDFNSYWLCYVMNDKTVRYQVEVVQYGAAQEQFNISHAINFWIPAPPQDEQNAIAAYLKTETVKFDALVTEAENAIELLKERRSALISSAVTGKIDVRNLSAVKEAA